MATENKRDLGLFPLFCIINTQEKRLFNGILVTRILGRKSGTLFANDNIFWGRVTTHSSSKIFFRSTRGAKIEGSEILDEEGGGGDKINGSKFDSRGEI